VGVEAQRSMSILHLGRAFCSTATPASVIWMQNYKSSEMSRETAGGNSPARQGGGWSGKNWRGPEGWHNFWPRFVPVFQTSGLWGYYLPALRA
jgi:hypothetical protein